MRTLSCRLSYFGASIVSSVILAAALPTHGSELAAPTIHDLDQATLSHRRGISTGQFIVESHLDDPENRVHSTFNAVTYLDGDSIREDLTERGRRQTVCFTPAGSYEYEYIPGVNAIVVARQKHYAELARSQRKLLEPRRLMMYPAWYRAVSNFPLDVLIGSTLRENLTIAKDDRFKPSSWRVSCTYKRDWAVTYWVVPAEDFEVARIEMDGTPGAGKKFAASVDARLERTDGFWFPAYIHFRETVDGALYYDEELLITARAVNQPLDPHTFQLAGLGVSPGTPIVSIPEDKRGTLKWDGHSIAVMTSDELLARGRTAPQNSRARSQQVLFVSSLVIALFAAGVYWRSYRKGRLPS